MSQFEIKEGIAIIPDGTTDIYDDSFSGCTSLDSITIPNSVTEIGDGAFLGCTSLKSIIIPESVKNIGNGTFDGCTSLVTINVPAKKTDYYKPRLPEELRDKIVELAPEKKTKK